MSAAIRVLVVDDAIEHAEMVVEFLRGSAAWPGAEVRTAGSYDAALHAFESETFDVAFFDYWLGARTGLMLLREIRQRGIDTPVIVLTSRGAAEVAVEAMKAGAADYLGKIHLSVETVERTIRYAIALHAEERQRRQAEAALRASEERFRALAENSSDALILLDANGRITYMTPSSERHLGWRPEQMVGRPLFDFIHSDDLEVVGLRMAETLQRPGQPVTHEVRFRHADGGWRIMEGLAVNRLDDPSVGAVVVNARDITDRRRLEEQLRQAQKMEAVGQLAGGVAHDFNNLLTAILGYCSLMLDEVRAEDPLRLDLEEIRSAGERAAALTRQLLAFSRRQMLQPQTVDLNALVLQLEKLLRRLINEDVTLVTTLVPEVIPVHVDPASLEQVLVNLAVNARDAMPLGGRLTIETANVTIGESAAGAHLPMPPGVYVMFSVGDTGHGMDEATRERIFEPFFTTKEQGKGTGLGLATVYGIVKQSGGYIWVSSEPGQGTVFKVYLPAAERPGGAGEADPSRSVQLTAGWETVLLVEDDDAVRALAREVLRRQGYIVIDARNGLDAVRLAEQYAEPIHAMVTDIVMPHMSGRDVAERLCAARPGLKLLFMSGYTDHALMQGLTPSAAFLRKPFTPEVLARAIRGLLDASV